MNQARYDPRAIAKLSGEVLGWAHRVAPPGWHGRTVADVVAGRPRLFGPDGPDGPVAVIDRAALRHNLAAMAGWCRDQRASIAPHAKTTMAPELIAAQIDHGAWGVTVASLAQARVLRGFGVTPIMVANQVADVANLRWVAAELGRDPRFRLLSWVDSAELVERMDAELARAGAPRPVDVLVELGIAGARTGCRTREDAERVARAAAGARCLRLAGVAGYEGVVAAGPRDGGIEEVDAYLARLRELAHALAGRGRFGECDEVIVSAGGSGYFDRVAAVLGGGLGIGVPVRLVLRSGCYLTHDHGLYAGLTPAARGVAGAPRFRAALRVWARVVSRPEPLLAVLAAGRRDLPYDQGLPRPVAVVAGGRSRPAPPGWEITTLYDQHAVMSVAASDAARPGDWVGLGISHPCTVFDRWNLLVLADGEQVTGLVRTFF